MIDTDQSRIALVVTLEGDAPRTNMEFVINTTMNDAMNMTLSAIASLVHTFNQFAQHQTTNGDTPQQVTNSILAAFRIGIGAVVNDPTLCMVESVRYDHATEPPRSE